MTEAIDRLIEWFDTMEEKSVITWQDKDNAGGKIVAILKSPVLSMVIASLDKGTIFPPHTHTCPEIIIGLTGEGVYQDVETGKEKTIGYGDVVHVPTGTNHKFISLKSDSYLLGIVLGCDSVYPDVEIVNPKLADILQDIEKVTGGHLGGRQ